MTFVSKTALRELIRESLSTSEDNWTALEDLEGLETLPVLVNPSLDSNLGGVDGSIVDVQFVPSDKTEFEVAIRSLTKNLPDEIIGTLYKRFRDLVSDVEGEDVENGCETHGGVKEMKKTKNSQRMTIEETIRRMVRKIISEEISDDAPKSKKIPIAIAGGKHRPKAFADFEDETDDELSMMQTLNDPDTWDTSSPEEREEHRKMVDRDEGFDVDIWDTADVDKETKSDWDPDDESEWDMPEKQKRKNAGGSGHGMHGKQFADIAEELGFSAAGAKRLEHVALAKLQYMLDLGPAESSELVMDAVDDYITKLAKTGNIDEEEVLYLYQNADMVADLEGFREFLHDVIRKEMKKDGIEFYPKTDEKGKPILDKQGAQIHRGKKDGGDED